MVDQKGYAEVRATAELTGVAVDSWYEKMVTGLTAGSRLPEMQGSPDW